LGLILGFILFIASEIMLFASFFWAYFHMKLKGGFLTEYMFPAYPIHGVTLQTGIGNTIILILSGTFLSLVLASLGLNLTKGNAIKPEYFLAGYTPALAAFSALLVSVFKAIGAGVFDLQSSKNLLQDSPNNILNSPFDNFEVSVFVNSFSFSFTSVTMTFVIIIASIVALRLYVKAFSYMRIATSTYVNLYKQLMQQAYLGTVEIFGNKRMLNKFFPLLFANLYFLLFANFWGLFISAFSITGHVYFTFSLGFFSFIFSILVGLKLLELDFFSLFTPHNCPRPLLPLLSSIEALSYNIRPISLSVRLFANILAGHILIHIITDAIRNVFNVIAFTIVLIFFFAIMTLESAVAGIQAYIFDLLSKVYFVDNIRDRAKTLLPYRFETIFTRNLKFN
jgi:F-type H+-transporting ATPase subunit a